MSKWITDRRPKRHDADVQGLVYCTDLSGDVLVTHWDSFSFDTSMAWMARDLPEPYVPTVDTSVKASIDRCLGEHRRNNRFRTDGQCKILSQDSCSCVRCDVERIIEAAQKWDEYISNSAVQESKPEAFYPVRKSDSTGVWMASVDNSESAARRVAVDCMFALGLDPSDFRTRDKIITGISDRIDGMLNYISRKASDVPRLEAELDAVRAKEKDRDDQFHRLRMWCLQRTGHNTNTLIGTPGFPDNLVDCVIACIEKHDAEAEVNDE